MPIVHRVVWRMVWTTYAHGIVTMELRVQLFLHVLCHDTVMTNYGKQYIEVCHDYS